MKQEKKQTRQNVNTYLTFRLGTQVSIILLFVSFYIFELFHHLHKIIKFSGT